MVPKSLTGKLKGLLPGSWPIQRHSQLRLMWPSANPARTAKPSNSLPRLEGQEHLYPCQSLHPKVPFLWAMSKSILDPACLAREKSHFLQSFIATRHLATGKSLDGHPLTLILKQQETRTPILSHLFQNQFHRPQHLSPCHQVRARPSPMQYGHDGEIPE